jgi:hypothetical protein
MQYSTNPLRKHRIDVCSATKTSLDMFKFEDFGLDI